MKKRQPEDTLSRYAQMGMAAMLPGMQLAVEFMQEKLDEMRAQLAAIQNGGPPKKNRVSPEGARAISEAQKRRWAAQKQGKDNAAMRKKISDARKAYWGAMSPAQRKAEMRRRMAKAQGKPVAAKAKPTVKLAGAA